MGDKSHDSSQNTREYSFVLFVAGNGPNSRIARNNLACICENELAGRCSTEIVDVLKDLSAAVKNNILVTPTLLMLRPEPEAVIIGNLRDMEKLRIALRLEEAVP